MRPSEHPDCERKFEVRVRDHAVFVKHAFDCFLRPRSILLGKFSAHATFHNTTRISHRQLSRHDQLDCLLDRFRIRVPGVHESHSCPACLHNLSIFMFNPATEFASLETEHKRSEEGSVSVEYEVKGISDLITFPPTSVFSLFRK